MVVLAGEFDVEEIHAQYLFKLCHQRRFFGTLLRTIEVKEKQGSVLKLRDVCVGLYSEDRKFC